MGGEQGVQVGETAVTRHPVGVRHCGEGHQVPRRQGELQALPEGHRAQTVDLKLILSRYLQPFGTYSGTVFGLDVAGVPGVTEEHVARW